jgi:6-phosphogluconate dehydrogenase
MEKEVIQEIGFIGLGRMGFNMVNRLLDHSKIKVTVRNRSEEPMQKLEKKGAIPSSSLQDLISKLPERKVIWLMLPSGKITEDTFQEILSLLNKDDILIDGANSNFKDSIRRHKEASKKGILMLDVGVSGGIVAAERGYAMMAGGSKEAYDFCLPLFESICMEKGFKLVGEEPGSGHYVKMIHNAIEYGMMQAIGEGFDLLKNGRFESLDLEKISNIWNHGTIVSSFLMEMTESALKNNNQDLSELQPYVDDSGEGEWSAIEALEQKVPFVVNSYAVHVRRISRQKGDYSYKLLAAIRNEFGGHAVKKK